MRQIKSEDFDSISYEGIETFRNFQSEFLSLCEEIKNEEIRLIKFLEKFQIEMKNNKQRVFKVKSALKITEKQLTEMYSLEMPKNNEFICRIYKQKQLLENKLIILKTDAKLLKQKIAEIERKKEIKVEVLNFMDHYKAKLATTKPCLSINYNEVLSFAKEKHCFSLSLIESQEEELQKVSREIHDGLIQMLANISVRLCLLTKPIKENRLDRAIDETKDMQKVIRQTLKDSYRIVNNIRPMILDDLGLVPAITKYTESTSEHHKVAIRFTNLGKVCRLPSKYETIFFRLIEEAVMNAIQHGKPSHIDVKLKIEENTLSMVVEDNGCGFDKEKINNDSFGIIGMKGRAEILFGECKIISTIGKGTLIYVKVPL